MNRKVLSKNSLLYNANFFKSYASKICAVVKADAYGHGVIEVVKILINSVDFFGVANEKEAMEIFKYFPKAKIIILGKSDNFSNLDKFYLTATSLEDVKLAIKLQKTEHCFIKLTVGMNRYGIDCKDSNALNKLKELIKNHTFAGFSVHFSATDSNYITKNEYQLFLKAKAFLQKSFPVCFGGSGAKNLPCDILRVGIGIYGYGNINLKKVMKIESSVLQVRTLEKGECAGYNACFKAKRKTVLAIVGVGYADGFSRSKSKKLNVFINGKQFPIVGNVCMDACFVDVTGGIVKEGDKVVMFHDAEIFAKVYKEIDYEILTRFIKFRGETRIV